jgi:hypothetical protein
MVNGVATCQQAGILEVNSGGEITTNTWANVGSWDAAGQESYLNISGGTFTAATQLYVGRGADGILNLTGGTIDLTGTGTGAWQNLRVGSDVGNSMVNISGVILRTYGLQLDNNTSGNANINLNGGTLQVNGGFSRAITAKDNSVIAIGDGRFQRQGNRNTDIDAMITSEYITFATPTVSTITASAE